MIKIGGCDKGFFPEVEKETSKGDKTLLKIFFNWENILWAAGVKVR